MSDDANTFDSMLADAEVLNSRLSKLEGAGDLGTHIVNVVKNKTVVTSQSSGHTANVDVDRTPTPQQASNATGDGADGSKIRVSADRKEEPS